MLTIIFKFPDNNPVDHPKDRIQYYRNIYGNQSLNGSQGHNHRERLYAGLRLQPL